MRDLFGAFIAKYLCKTFGSTSTEKCFHCPDTGLFKLKIDIWNTESKKFFKVLGNTDKA